MRVDSITTYAAGPLSHLIAQRGKFESQDQPAIVEGYEPVYPRACAALAARSVGIAVSLFDGIKSVSASFLTPVEARLPGCL
jgi:hypothetical protein